MRGDGLLARLERRPVTPEVAGSRPVSRPAEIPAEVEQPLFPDEPKPDSIIASKVTPDRQHRDPTGERYSISPRFRRASSRCERRQILLVVAGSALHSGSAHPAGKGRSYPRSSLSRGRSKPIPSRHRERGYDLDAQKPAKREDVS